MKNEFAQGVVWNLISRGGGQALQLVFSIALARLLVPSDFGELGMLLVFSGFAQLLADTGLSSALIHRRCLEDSDLSTVFWLQLSVGALLSVAFFALAGRLAAFFSDPHLASLARLFSPIFVIQAASLVHWTMLQRRMRFKRLASITIGAAIISGLTALVLALRGFGVWALLAQIMLQAVFTTIFSVSSLRWRPQLQFDRRRAREMGSYGGYLMGHSALNYWTRTGDNLVIGKFLGQLDLGIYTRAYSLMLLPLNNICAAFGQVLFPHLARLQDDPVEFRRVYLATLRTIAFLTFPIMTGMALLAREVILILFGLKWVEAVPVFAVLAWVGLIQTIYYPVGVVYSALGRTRAQFMLSMVLTVGFAVAMVVGLRGGLMGITRAYAVWSVAVCWLNIWYLGRIVGIGVRLVLRELRSIASATCVMGIGVYALERVASEYLPLFVSAVVCSIAGAIVYFSACLLLGEPALLSLQAKLRPARHERQAYDGHQEDMLTRSEAE